jgi:hypothetical protein
MLGTFERWFISSLYGRLGLLVGSKNKHNPRTLGWALLY